MNGDEALYILALRKQEKNCKTFAKSMIPEGYEDKEFYPRWRKAVPLKQGDRAQGL
jgi:hypothetical protein